MVLPIKLAAIPENYENAVKFAVMVSEVLARYPIIPVPVKLYPRGLADVAEGFEYMKAGKVCTFV